MKRAVLFAFAFTGLAACETPTSPPTRGPNVAGPSFAVIVNEQRLPFSISAANPCTGEPFVVEGEFHFLVTGNTSNSGNSHFHVHVNAHGEGVGASGARYVFNEEDNFTVHQNGPGPIVFQDVLSLLLIRQGSSEVPDNFVIKQNVRFTIDPMTGEFQIVRENFTVECRG